MNSKINFPYIRQSSVLGNAGVVRIEIGGDGMRIGKTTALNVIADGLRGIKLKIVKSTEDWKSNPYLGDGYSGDKDALLKSQKWFAFRKWEQLSEEHKDCVVLQDVYPEMDWVYARNGLELSLLNERQFDEYDRYYRELDWGSVGVPDLLVYLQARDDVLIDRARMVAREFEKDLNEDYYLNMKKLNREWRDGVGERMNILDVNTDDFDFANGDDEKEEFVGMVIERLGDNLNSLRIE